MDSDEVFNGPAPVVYVPPPMEAIRQNALRLQNRGDDAVAPKPEDTSARVSFIVPGRPEDVEGVVKAVYDDLKHGNQDADIQLDETVPCINVVAPTLDGAMTLIQTARDLADTYLSPASAEPRRLFVEPPVNCASDSQIVVGLDATTGRVRHRLQTTSKGTDSDSWVALSPYTQNIAEALHKALRQASTLNSSLILRVSLGNYRLQNYKPGSYTLKELEDMVTHPRATGRFNARLGGVETMERLTIATVINLIRAADTALCPTDNQTPTATQVLPAYTLEVCDDDWRYEARLEAILKGGEDKKGLPRYTLLPTHVLPRASRDPEFEITSMAVGRELDWKIEAVSRHKVSKTSGQCQLVQEGLAGAISEMRGTREDYRSYPVVGLTNEGYAILHGRLKSVVMKSKYKFSWKGSGHMVQLTINRRWKDLYDMVQAPPEDADFELSIYGENWDQDSKVRAGETVGKIWGNDLEGLLLDEPTKTAFGRVQGLVRTMRDIRDFFDDASRIGEQRLKN